MELYARAEADVAGRKTLRRAWQAFRITGEIRQRQKIFFSFDVDRIGLAVPRPRVVFIDGRSWSARVRTVIEMRDLGKVEIRGLRINRSGDRGSLA